MMTGWQFHAFTAPLLATTALSALFAVMLWRRRSQHGALTLLVLMAGAGAWTFGEAAELGCETLAGHVWWSYFRYVALRRFLMRG